MSGRVRCGPDFGACQDWGAPIRYTAQHVALGVTDLDAWVAKLRDEDVTFLEEPHPLDDTRAAMIEGPSLEAIELVDIS